MKFRTVLTIVLGLAVITGGILLYGYFKKPPTPPAIAKTSPLNKPVIPLPEPDHKPSKPATPLPEPDHKPSKPAAPTTSTQTDKTVPPKGRVATLESKPRTPKLSERPLPSNSIADWILVEKKARRLTLFRKNQPFKSYDIALGQQPDGPKRFQGDNKTPEGRYKIDSRKKNSSYHRALHISYPNPNDVAFASKQQRSAGGDIMIHGLPKGMGSMGSFHLLRDWTAGCIAVTNTEIEELWQAIPDGTPIEIRP
jgi:lipoprotein-anchoring transpeptidase ErfK/SrfK